MTDTVAVLTEHGLANAAAIVQVALEMKVPIAIAAAFAQQESNGYMVYGHDLNGTWSTNNATVVVDGVTYKPGSNIPVTSNNYKQFYRMVVESTPQAHTNGVGIFQLTSRGYLIDAKSKGRDLGEPIGNCREGLEIIAKFLAAAATKAPGVNPVVYAGAMYNRGNWLSSNSWTAEEIARKGYWYTDQLLAKLSVWNKLLNSPDVSVPKDEPRSVINMVNIDSVGHWLESAAAESYKRMVADGMPSGGIASAGRTYAEQTALYAAYKAGTGNLAAKPGTSLHETGLALDVTRGTAQHGWMTSGGDLWKVNSNERIRANAYGWYRTVPSEAWHFSYDAGRDTKKTVTKPNVSTTPTVNGPVIRLGDTSNVAWNLKRDLKKYFPKGTTKIDDTVAYWGQDSKNTLAQLQRNMNSELNLGWSESDFDGVPGPKTWAALAHYGIYPRA